MADVDDTLNVNPFREYIVWMPPDVATPPEKRLVMVWCFQRQRPYLGIYHDGVWFHEPGGLEMEFPPLVWAKIVDPVVRIASRSRKRVREDQPDRYRGHPHHVPPMPGQPAQYKVAPDNDDGQKRDDENDIVFFGPGGEFRV